MHQRGDLTRDSQLIYLSQWLGEFSEVEKDDFLQQLLDLYAPGQLAIGQRLAPLKAEDKVPTLFDCRIDLFKKWFASWEATDREELLERLKEADPEFVERFQKSKDTPNEDKIIEEFWLRLDNGSIESNGHAPVPEPRIASVHENGTSGVQENGDAAIQANGVAASEERDETAVSENGTDDIHVNGAVGSQENGSVEASGIPHQNGIIPTVEVSSPASETKEEGNSETATENVASIPSDEPTIPASQDEESQAVPDKSQEAIENES